MPGSATIGRRLAILLPFLWLALFFAVPFIFVVKISLSEAAFSIPPVTDLFAMDGGLLTIRLNFDNYGLVLGDSLYLTALLTSLRLAFTSTLLCLLIGYPMAYAIARAEPGMRMPLLLLVILPFWTSFLIRVYAWMTLLQDQGMINSILIWTGIIDSPLRILNTDIAVQLGIVYSYLPFMILPLYATLERLDKDLLEAAADLGARPWTAFLRVTLPLSLPGIAAGSLLVFIPAAGEFVIPELLGGPDTLMIGKILWQEFFNNRDWPVAAALATMLLVLLAGPILLLERTQAEDKP
ncbi:MAG: ABC transporter permease subunit [Pseudomonadota bacterium]|nr:ABC transporter permease subunit [Pseudomonadota bacterium]